MRRFDMLIKSFKAVGRDRLTDYIGLYLVGILSLGYSFFQSYFAKLHVYSSFLGTPIFIGDIVFAICFFLFFLKWLKGDRRADIFTCLFLFYLCFVFLKTSIGYLNWGPLALRHSVLFFYPLFAVFCYSFYRSDFFNNNKNLFFIFLLFLILKFFTSYRYFVLTSCMLALVLINNYPKGRLKYFLYCVLLVCIPYKMLFITSRSFLVGNLFSLLFIGFGFVYLLNIKRIFKYILLLLIILSISIGISRISVKNEVASLIGFKELTKRYVKLDKIMRVREQAFVESKLPVKLYNERSVLEFSGDEENIQSLRANQSEDASEFLKVKESEATADRLWPADRVDPEALKAGDRGISVPYMNSLFRIFIWKEAFDKLINERPVFGFDFGNPFRCRALEILDWGTKEWERDGWICFHNSYIDIIYRAGLIGVFMIVFILIMLFSLIAKLFQNKSLNGVLLVGMLLNWFVAASFGEVLEMPYTAIPLWSLFGLTFAYLFKNKTV